MKQYLDIKGVVYKKDGWSQKDLDTFMENLYNLMGIYQPELQATFGYETKTEKEMGDE